MLPQPKPRAMREHLVVPSIGRRDVARAEWPDIRRFEHFLKLLHLFNDAFNVHASHSSSTKCEWVKRSGIGLSCAVDTLPVRASSRTNTRCSCLRAQSTMWT